METITLNTCCENCNDVSLQTVILNPCDDYVNAPIDVAVAPKGRLLSVTLNLPPVCDTKDVNIGIFLTEVLADGTEIPFAYKVIRRSATGITGACIDDRDCARVNFLIDDDNACAPIRTFNVRTQAHYLSSRQIIGAESCPCNCRAT